MRMLLMLTMCLILAAAPAAAQKTLEAVPLDDSQVQRLDLDVLGVSTCQIGNINPNAWAISDWIWGNEAYAYHIYPPDFMCCNVGFTLDAVTMTVYFASADVPSTFDVYAGMSEAVWDAVNLCWAPGPEACVSPIYRVNITNVGAYAIQLPMGGTCACAHYDYDYFINFHFVTTFPSTKRPHPVTDAFPLGCTSYNDYGAGWEDLVAVYGWPGELKMRADITCCEGPIGVDPQTWGGIKGLYR